MCSSMTITTEARWFVFCRATIADQQQKRGHHMSKRCAHFVVHAAARSSAAAAASVGFTNSRANRTSSDHRPAAPTASPAATSTCQVGACEGFRRRQQPYTRHENKQRRSLH